MYTCPYCTFHSMNKKALNMHIEEKHKNKVEQQKQGKGQKQQRSKPQSTEKQGLKKKLAKNCFDCVHASAYSSVEVMRGRCYCSKWLTVVRSGSARICGEFVRDKWSEMRALGKSWSEIHTQH